MCALLCLGLLWACSDPQRLAAPTHAHTPSFPPTDDDLDESDNEPADAPGEEEGVLVLTASNFANTIKRNKFVLVRVCVAWLCVDGLCVSLCMGNCTPCAACLWH